MTKYTEIFFVEDDRTLSDLPTFGGDSPDDTHGVFFWDPTRLLVSDGLGGFELCPRTYEVTCEDMRSESTGRAICDEINREISAAERTEDRQAFEDALTALAESDKKRGFADQAELYGIRITERQAPDMGGL